MLISCSSWRHEGQHIQALQQYSCVMRKGKQGLVEVGDSTRLASEGLTHTHTHIHTDTQSATEQ